LFRVLERREEDVRDIETARNRSLLKASHTKVRSALYVLAAALQSKEPQILGTKGTTSLQ